MRGNNFEIQAAKFALQMSRSEINRAFNRQMIADHTWMGAQVSASVAQADPRMKLPVAVMDRQWDMLKAPRASGRGFDRMYRTPKIDSHRATCNPLK